MNYLHLLDYAGVAVFAATGALAASRLRLDIVGFIFFAAITGVGGGTLRDLLLGKLPVFWIKQPLFIGICVIIAVLVFFTAHLVESRYRLLLWLDAIGMAAYCVMGAMIGLEYGISPYAAIVTGISTATFGGIFRDVISGEKSVLLSDEIYISAALLGATSFVFLFSMGVPQIVAVFVGVLLAFGLRAAALLFGWTTPRYKPRQGRKIK
ncbi:trimeric intracellular cation channel family protein [Cocleimonas flava]|uniref:Putative membrane protein YeiH n=1 Tax=Cocleimonas flava TaxID=634765 RepID=A0A4R1EVS2_9GAMM|nr:MULTISPECIES: trimeric intracellular cation channel family protein [Cocleimonas]MEB8433848.1 trimeric intracellular cation channel family protein [Cocleimonas sp. KMM 6892]MEC4716659.1 trimeric intracellular cation channel family protein [Cocleimonas sp. KMM 6895]MEC4746186.1 trimeric intracellular cation channel family protein [Cocleimonas sp. KMM 6896]TCJ84830.1 putative membrane protein YeiH [Cocleimonas flava]